MTITAGSPEALAFEAAARRLGAPQRKWSTPGALAQDLLPTPTEPVVQTPALDLIDAELVALIETPDARLLLSMPPQEGKSQRAARAFALWVLHHHPETRIAIVSAELELARTLTQTIRDDVTMHSEELGLMVQSDLSRQREWSLVGHRGGCYGVGIGGMLTGRPVDLMIIDDPFKDAEQADSELYRTRAMSWWQKVGEARMAPGGQVVLIGTRWHEGDLHGQLLAGEDSDRWRVINIPAQADHKPEEGEVDPLGREPGEFMVSARGRTAVQWQEKRVAVGSRAWTAMYQGQPSPEGGTIFKRSGFKRYGHPLWIEQRDRDGNLTGAMILPSTPTEDLLMSWDMAFKDLKSSDYVVGQVWLRQGGRSYLLDQVRDRMDFPETLRRVRALAVKWPQVLLKLVEDKANGPAVIAMLRNNVAGLVPVEPEGSKPARARAVSPLVEAESVWLPSAEMAPWADGLIDEAADFPYGKFDDQVDAMSQALNRLIIQPLGMGAPQSVPDPVYDEPYLAPWPGA